MAMPRTESTDIQTWEAMAWRITPLNIPVLNIEAPTRLPELRDVEAEEAVRGGIGFSDVTREGTIDVTTHQTLLEESLAKHRDIWRTLAEK